MISYIFIIRFKTTNNIILPDRLESLVALKTEMINTFSRIWKGVHTFIIYS